MRILTATLVSLTISVVATTSLAETTGVGVSAASGVVVAQTDPVRPAAGAPQTSTEAKRRLTEQQSFKVARFVNTCAAYELFLKDYPSGEFANQAQRLIKQKCRPSRATDAPEPSQSIAKQAEPAKSPSSTPRRQVAPGERVGKAATARGKPKRARKKSRSVAKKPVVKRESAARRSRVKRCRMETNWECVRRGGQMEFGSCSRQRICE